MKAAAFARLGESEEQCKARYGNPEIFMPDAEATKRLELGAYGNSADYTGDINEHVEKPNVYPDKMLGYKSDRASIIVGFKDDKAISIQYRFEQTWPLTGAMVEGLLQVNVPETAWFWSSAGSLDDKAPFEIDGKSPSQADIDKWADEQRAQSRGIFWSVDGKYYAKFDRWEGVVSILLSSIRPTYKFDHNKKQLLESF